MNKNILISLIVVSVMSAIAIGGTIAYFSDTENSTNNTFSAGILNLKVGDNDPTTWNFQIEDIKPGDKGYQEIIVQNIGNLDGYLHITFANLIDDDFSCSGPESEVDATCGAGKAGELAENLDILIYLDENSNDAFNLGTDTLVYQGKVKGILQADLFNYYLAKGASRDFRIEWQLSSSIGNIVQTDKTGFDINFELTQNKKEDIVGDWHFNEKSGNIAYDSELQPANNGTINGATWTDGKYNPALSFDGVNDYVEVPDSPSLDLTGALSVEAWVYIRNMASANYIVSKGNDDKVNGQYGILLSNNQFSFHMYEGDHRYILGSNATTQKWYHVVGTWDGTTMKLYINGFLNSSGTWAGSLTPNNLNLQIGRLGKPNWMYQFDGIIDEVRIYNRALSAAEILKHYQAGIGQ